VPGARGQRGLEQQQKEHVAQFFAGFGLVVGADGRDKLEGLLNDVVAQALGRLLLVPGAAAGAQKRLDDFLDFGNACAVRTHARSPCFASCAARAAGQGGG